MSLGAAVSERLRRCHRAIVAARGRPNLEYELAFNRIVFGPLILAFILLFCPEQGGLGVSLAYIAVGPAVLLWLDRSPGDDVARRVIVMIVDIGSLSLVMQANGADGAALYPLYLWIVFGNGFRFGLGLLYGAVATSVVAFGMVALTTPFWLHAPALTLGTLTGLLVLPSYAATLIRKLSRAKQDAEAASQAKSYFLASVSHELRTPLTAIIGLGEHLRDSRLTPDERETAATIVGAGRSLLALINQLLDFSRIQAKGFVPAEQAPFDLIALLTSVRALMRHQAEQKGLRLLLHIAADVPVRITGDASHLRDILTNLVGNAVKFTEHGEIVIRVRAGANGAAEGGAPMLTFEVADTGIGIAADAQERIFASFAQADATIIDRFGGTGLGLAICRELAEMLGGTIGVESAPGTGSRFWFTIPYADAPSDALVLPATGAILTRNPVLTATFQAVVPEIAIERIESAAQVAEAVAQRAMAVFVDAGMIEAEGLSHASVADAIGRPAVLIGPDRSDAVAFATRIPRNADGNTIRAAVRIAGMMDGREIADFPVSEAHRQPLHLLIADDNAVNRKVFGMMLGRAGHQVSEAADGEGALDMMRDGRFDLILMDVNMPRLNGIEATRLYRFAALGQRRVPIVGVTADASDETRTRCIEAGMDACVAKPVDSEQLLALIDELAAAATIPVTIGHDPTGTVTPLFATETMASAPILDPAAITELTMLGGEAFVRDLVAVYREEAAAMLAAAEVAVAEDNAEGFREATHALRSSAANIGAMQLAELCLHYQRIDGAAFRAQGARHARRLADALADAGAALAAQVAGVPPAAAVG